MDGLSRREIVDDVAQGARVPHCGDRDVDEPDAEALNARSAGWRLPGECAGKIRARLTHGFKRSGTIGSIGHFMPSLLEEPPQHEPLVRFVIATRILDTRHCAPLTTQVASQSR